MKIPCCNSMAQILSNSRNFSATDGFKPCWIVNQYVNENDLKIGDVVTYKYKTNETILHRLKEKCNDTSEMFYYTQGNKTYVIGDPLSGWIIKGDNNSKPDKYSDSYCVPAWAIQSRFKYKLFCLADYIG